MARKSFYSISLEESDVVVDENVNSMSDSEVVEAENNVVSEATEIQDDIATVEESQEVVEELQEQVETNEEALDNNEVTDELVQASNESFMYALGRLHVPREHISRYRVSCESYATNHEKLRISNENAKDFIKNMIEKIKAFFKKIWEKIKEFMRKIAEFLGIRKKKIDKIEDEAEKAEQEVIVVEAAVEAQKKTNTDGKSIYDAEVIEVISNQIANNPPSDLRKTQTPFEAQVIKDMIKKTEGDVKELGYTKDKPKTDKDKILDIMKENTRLSAYATLTDIVDAFSIWGNHAPHDELRRMYGGTSYLLGHMISNCKAALHNGNAELLGTEPDFNKIHISMSPNEALFDIVIGDSNIEFHLVSQNGLFSGAILTVKGFKIEKNDEKLFNKLKDNLSKISLNQLTKKTKELRKTDFVKVIKSNEEYMKKLEDLLKEVDTKFGTNRTLNDDFTKNVNKQEFLKSMLRNISGIQSSVMKNITNVPKTVNWFDNIMLDLIDLVKKMRYSDILR